VSRPETVRGSGVADSGTDGPPHGGPSVRLADACARRAAVYEALTYGFGEPGAAYVEALASGRIVAVLRDAVAGQRVDAAAYELAFATLEEAASTMAAAGVDTALRDLRVEYARLFTGPGRPAVMCYASEYLDVDDGGTGSLNGVAATSAEAAYRAEGVSPAAARGDLADRMTTELEFLFHLCRREEAAWAAEESAEAVRLHRSLDGFLHEHAGRWLPRFAASVRSLAVQPAYSGMAELLSAHLAAELGAAPSDAADPGR
jgi:putative dimethyl sulfoxide reductase chaperone